LGIVRFAFSPPTLPQRTRKGWGTLYLCDLGLHLERVGHPAYRPPKKVTARCYVHGLCSLKLTVPLFLDESTDISGLLDYEIQQSVSVKICGYNAVLRVIVRLSR
jgi:hypothetical protein